MKKLTKDILVVSKLKAALVPLNYFQLFGNILGKITFYSVATFPYTLVCFEILKRYEMVHANDISRRYGFPWQIYSEHSQRILFAFHYVEYIPGQEILHFFNLKPWYFLRILTNSIKSSPEGRWKYKSCMSVNKMFFARAVKV